MNHVCEKDQVMTSDKLFLSALKLAERALALSTRIPISNYLLAH